MYYVCIYHDMLYIRTRLSGQSCKACPLLHRIKSIRSGCEEWRVSQGPYSSICHGVVWRPHGFFHGVAWGPGCSKLGWVFSSHPLTSPQPPVQEHVTVGGHVCVHANLCRARRQCGEGAYSEACECKAHSPVRWELGGSCWAQAAPPVPVLHRRGFVRQANPRLAWSQQPCQGKPQVQNHLRALERHAQY